MKKNICLLLIFTMAIPAFAQINLTGHAPTVSGYGAEIFNQKIDETFQSALNELNDQLKVFKSPDKFLKAMGDSSVFASHGATTRNYGGYKRFSITIGPVVGVQLPKDILSMKNDYMTDDDTGMIQALKDEGDIKAGISPNALNANIGFNMNTFKFFPEKLGVIKRDRIYLGIRAGYFKLPDELNLDKDLTINYNNLTLGLTLNYQLIPSVSLAKFVTWRGVSIGSGFIYNRSKIGFDITVDDIRESIDANASVVIEKPKASINLSTNTYTIPVEVITAIKLIIFNIPIGVGADISFGKTNLEAGVTADIDIDGDLPPGLSKDKKGDVMAFGALSNSPSILNYKIMTGLGVTAGPVIIDVPLTFYPPTGYSIGVTIGVVF